MPSIRQRVDKIDEEISGVASQYGVTSWELEFLESVKTRTVLTEKQLKILKGIEEKVFNADD